jgi:hypothetical protein
MLANLVAVLIPKESCRNSPWCTLLGGEKAGMLQSAHINFDLSRVLIVSLKLWVSPGKSNTQTNELVVWYCMTVFCEERGRYDLLCPWSHTHTASKLVSRKPGRHQHNHGPCRLRRVIMRIASERCMNASELFAQVPLKQYPEVSQLAISPLTGDSSTSSRYCSTASVQQCLGYFRLTPRHE